MQIFAQRFATALNPTESFTETSYQVFVVVFIVIVIAALLVVSLDSFFVKVVVVNLDFLYHKLICWTSSLGTRRGPIHGAQIHYDFSQMEPLESKLLKLCLS